MKLASCKYLDGLPTSGNKLGRAFRDLEWEEPRTRIWLSALSKGALGLDFYWLLLRRRRSESSRRTALTLSDSQITLTLALWRWCWRSLESELNLVASDLGKIRRNKLHIYIYIYVLLGPWFFCFLWLVGWLLPSSLAYWLTHFLSMLLLWCNMRYFLHDVRVVRLPRHGASAQSCQDRPQDIILSPSSEWGASCPVGVGVSCSADRQAKVGDWKVVARKAGKTAMIFWETLRCAKGQIRDLTISWWGQNHRGRRFPRKAGDRPCQVGSLGLLSVFLSMTESRRCRWPWRKITK